MRVHPRCTNLKFQLRTGVFNSKQTDYLRSERTGHIRVGAFRLTGNFRGGVIQRRV